MDFKMMMDMLTPLLFGAFALSVLVHAQDQTGFISIDCGASADYIDDITGINYVSDETYRDTGVSKPISSQLQSNYFQPYHNVRTFPDGTRNCYTVRPSQAVSTKYLIRASFLYADYDSQDQVPQFDLYLGPNYWDTVEIINATMSVFKEILYVLTSNDTSICLINTGNGVPFISVLELRPIKNTVYVTKSGTLALFRRWDFGTTKSRIVRYKYDVYDRIWSSFSWPELGQLNTSSTIDNWPGVGPLNTSSTIADKKTDFQPPSVVMSTAVTPNNVSDPIKFYWDPQDPTTQFYIYMHFAEVEQLQGNQIREFTITLNGSLWYGPLRPEYLYSTTIFTTGPYSSTRLEFWITRTEKSTLPPLLNALEIYSVKYFLQSQTSQGEDDAMKNIKSTYGVKRNWQGDPCAPQAYMWAGLNCSFNGYDPPKITTLNLSSSGLTGEIPSYIESLTYLQILDLSNNSLNGSVPSFLTQLPSLTVLNISKNKLTGSVPADLIEKSKKRVLALSVDENLNLCASTSCNKKGNNVVVPVVASIAGAAIFILLAALLFIWFNRKRRNQEQFMNSNIQKFTYSQIESITNNFEQVIGGGGFGEVYRGTLRNGNQVAVKLLSPLSKQGPKEFQYEVKLMTRFHHGNLVSLIGYCDDGKNMALVYEYMANGNLRQHLSETSTNVLHWKQRIQIAVDIAQGLDYLHNGCKPPIIHRDMKTSNILLNENWQAKIADFGLSRDFINENDTHLTTTLAGTPAYMDPKIQAFANQQTDVYSYGIVLLELITGRPPIIKGQESTHITHWVSPEIERGDIQRIIDQRLQGAFDVNCAWKAVEIANSCVESNATQRPDIGQVVMQLKECLASEHARMQSNMESGSSSHEISVTDDLSLLSGR